MRMLFTLFFFFVFFYSFSQTRQDTSLQLDYYQIESDGFLMAPIETSYGLLFTNNHCNTLYLNNSSGLQLIDSTKGCGRYFSVSPDSKLIGYKRIEKSGKQLPILKNLETNKEQVLHTNSNLCGQISFSENGFLAYSSDKEIYLYGRGKISKKFSIDEYVNFTVISPDANQIVYCNAQDQVVIINTNTSESIQITNDPEGYAFPKWSPNSKQLLFQSFNGEVFVWNQLTNLFSPIGKLASPVWYNDSVIIYEKRITNQDKLISTDIYLYDVVKQKDKQLTFTIELFEMNPSVNGNTIIYHTYKDKQIYKLRLDHSYNVIHQAELLFDGQSLQYTTTKEDLGQTFSSSTIYIPNVPYVHQMYDTPDWHAGSGSCGPTSAMMLLAYYNKLPKWKDTVCCPYSHSSEYGKYVASKYHFNENAFDLSAADANGNSAWGGYGYIWSQASPRIIMDDYLNLHGLNADTAVDGENYQKVLQQLSKNYPYPICNFLTSSGHIVIATGAIHPQRTIICNDPYGNKSNQTWPGYTGIDAYYDWPGYNNGYENFDGGYGYGGIAWTMKVEGQEKFYNDTIIDDLDFNHGFVVENETPSHMYYFRDNKTGGHDNHFWWTYSMANNPSICSVSWTPTIPMDGKYAVSAYIPQLNAEASAAKYSITHALGSNEVFVDQYLNQGNWVNLGSYYFKAGQNGKVVLGDSTGTDNEKLAFDAIKWEKENIVFTDISDLSELPSFSVTPNPVYDKLMIRLNQNYAENFACKIYNSIGEDVFTSTMNSYSFIPVSFLSPGLYHLIISYQNQWYSAKFVKK